MELCFHLPLVFVAFCLFRHKDISAYSVQCCRTPRTTQAKNYIKFARKVQIMKNTSSSSSSSMALQPEVGLGLLYNTPLSLSIPCSVPPFVYSIFLRSVDTSSSHLIFGLPLRLVAYSLPWMQHGLNVPCAKCQIRGPLSSSGIRGLL